MNIINDFQKTLDKIGFNFFAINALAFMSISLSSISVVAEPLKSSPSQEDSSINNSLSQETEGHSVEATSVLATPEMVDQLEKRDKLLPLQTPKTARQREYSGRGGTSPRTFFHLEQVTFRQNLFLIIDNEYNRCMNQATRFYGNSPYKSWISQCAVIRDNGQKFLSTIPMVDYFKVDPKEFEANKNK